MIHGGLPKLSEANGLYLTVLLAMVLGFYLLLLACLVAAGYALYQLVLWTPTFLENMHGSGAIKLLIILYVGIAVFLWALLKALVAKVGGDPVGIKALRVQYPKVFALLDEVAGRVQAEPIRDIFITAEDELGVWEEAALYLPPGMGKRKIVLGMGALNYLTLDQLRSILAHEYGHFSNRDTFFSRFIYRVSNSYAALMYELSGHQRIQVFNPLYWLLRGYTWLYELIAASFSRNREYHADRFAVEAYGRDSFAEALVAAHLEGTFFNEIGVRQVIKLASEGKGFKNLYHFVGVSRQMYEKDNPDTTPQILQEILAAKSKPFDSHPSLRERLTMQGLPPSAVPVPLRTRRIAHPELDNTMDEEAKALTQTGAPCAAEELFGDQVAQVQADLSDLLASKYIYLIQKAREAQSQG